jgi:agmatine deiminase
MRAGAPGGADEAPLVTGAGAGTGGETGEDGGGRTSPGRALTGGASARFGCDSGDLMKVESSDIKSWNSSRGSGAAPFSPLSPSSTIRCCSSNRISVISRTAQMREETATCAGTVADFSQPAEWAPHEACWVAWPSAVELWGENLSDARRSFVALCAAISDVDPQTGRPRGERLEVLVPTPPDANEAAQALTGLGARLHEVPFGDIWLRDIAPVFVTGPGGVAATTFAFNGWGGKYVLPHDAEVAGRIASIAGLLRRPFPWVLEGGSVDVDGEGTCLTTRQCLLNPNRNPTMDERAVERALASALGISKVLWLSRGLVNDHTDGHIDTLARFVQPGVVVCMEARGDDDPNANTLGDVARELATLRDARGRPLEVVRIPSPGRIVSSNGDVMPASYVNFYVGNRTVVVPTYGARWDDEAVRAVAHIFPERHTVGIDATAILTGGGAFHCITQQQPKAGARTPR